MSWKFFSFWGDSIKPSASYHSESELYPSQITWYCKTLLQTQLTRTLFTVYFSWLLTSDNDSESWICSDRELSETFLRWSAWRTLFIFMCFDRFTTYECPFMLRMQYESAAWWFNFKLSLSVIQLFWVIYTQSLTIKSDSLQCLFV